MGKPGDKAGDELLWRETYFIVLPRGNRPTAAQVKKSLTSAGGRLALKNLAGNSEGQFESVFVESLEDHAAVEISYESGEGVLEQNRAWAEQLKREASREQLQMLLSSDSRLDVVHFERVSASPRGGTGAPGSPRRAAGKGDDQPRRKFAGLDDAGHAMGMDEDMNEGMNEGIDDYMDDDMDFHKEENGEEHFGERNDDAWGKDDAWGDNEARGDEAWGDEARGDDDSLGGWEEDASPDDDCELLDPTCLLTVVEALSKLTKGLAFDPAAGSLL